MPRGTTSANTKLLVWSRAGGVCCRPGCGKVLHRDPMMTGKCIPIGEVAHNVAASPKGPRGSIARSETLSDDPNNSLLLCPTCHDLVDKSGMNEIATEELLRRWKTQHEDNIEMLARYTSEHVATGILATGMIRGRAVMLNKLELIKAAFQCGFVLNGDIQAIELPSAPRDATGRPVWESQAAELRGWVNAVTRITGPAAPIIVAGLAEMPSLIYLGFLLGNERVVIPLQPNHANGSLSFSDPDATAADIHALRPEHAGGSRRAVNLVLALSAPVDRSRYEPFEQEGEDTIVITTQTPNREIVKSRATIDAFSRAVLQVQDFIETTYGANVRIRVFPVVPAPLAIAFGAQLSPKLGSLVEVYDADGADRLFKHALTIHEADRVMLA